ncbi:MAG: cellulase family glycosylhydrolase, partial [Calditrichia bacterium]|nr:cellulase family glycosylhydrolase [Calditrichia bacterium]
MKLLFFYLIFSFMFLLGCNKKSPTKSEPDPETFLTPQQVIGNIMRGINIGNTLEPPDEGGWNNGPLQEYYFDDYESAGFTCIRIPVKWGTHTSESSPFNIDPSWIDRVEQVVDWGLERDLYIIINGHHEDWLKNDYSPANQARYDSIWSQISVRFKDKSPRLMFEMINEPYGMTLDQINDLNFRILSIIRKTNPRRIVIYSGHGWSALDDMLAAAIPDDDYLMAYWHAYNPWSFAGEGNGIWGSEADRNAIHSMFQQAANWSNAHNIPVIISEFGAIHDCDYNSRMIHYYTYVEAAVENNIAFQAWDDGGWFRIYERDSRTWPEVKDILINTFPEGPDLLQTIVAGDSAVVLTWQNRSTGNTGMVVERGAGNTDFTKVAELEAGIARYIDSGIVDNGVYYYRIISVFSDHPDMYSYPVRVSISGNQGTRSPYHGTPFQIPATIQAEDYDIGGEGLTYHDTGALNIPGDYRPNEGVDIEERNDGGFHIGYIESGEWVEYTINVPNTAEYNITVFT